MRIFSPLPGEYIASALKRGNELLGIKSIAKEEFYIKPIPRIGFGISKCLMPVKTESRDYAKFKFPEFLTKHNITENVLNNNTLHPLNAALGRSRAYTEVTPKIWMRMCHDCVLEDIETHGSPYIHCRHVLSSVMFCSIHGSALIESCPQCSVPIRKHDITKLGICSKRYKYSKRSKAQLNSTPRLYAKFIADLLGYRGATVKRTLADAVIHQSVTLKYAKRYADDNSSLGLDNIIARELGISITLGNNGRLLDKNLSLCAFLGCITADHYFDLLTNEDTRTLLRKNLHEAGVSQWHPY